MPTRGSAVERRVGRDRVRGREMVEGWITGVAIGRPIKQAFANARTRLLHLKSRGPIISKPVRVFVVWVISSLITLHPTDGPMDPCIIIRIRNPTLPPLQRFHFSQILFFSRCSSNFSSSYSPSSTPWIDHERQRRASCLPCTAMAWLTSSCVFFGVLVRLQ